jgi:ADP-heptose:LPS heptosyltransferase
MMLGSSAAAAANGVKTAHYMPPAYSMAPKRPLQPIVIRFGRLGDMVMLTSLLQLLHQRFGLPCQVFAAGPWNEPLYRGHPDVGRLWLFARHFPMALSFTWWRALRELRRSDPSPIYVCEYQPRQVRRIRRLLAFARINLARCVFISDDPADVASHWLDRLASFGQRTPAAVSAAAYPPPLIPCVPAPRLYVMEADVAELTAWLQSRGWDGRLRILIQPGNFRSMSARREQWRENDDKAWPLAKWARLLHLVHAAMPEALIILCGAPAEAPMLKLIEVATALPQVVVAQLPLRRLLALCQAADSMISIDTGPAHAAAALGLPLVVMYGAENPRLWLPRSPSGSPVLAIGGPPLSRSVAEISAAEVFNTWHAMRSTIPSHGETVPQRAPGQENPSTTDL